MNERMKYVLALVVGLLAIPGMAFAANEMLGSDESAGAPESAPVVLEVPTTTTVAAESFTADDLVRACGVEGHYLVELEAASAADSIQLAALSALRPICDEVGLPLPPAPIPEEVDPIVETVTVVRRVAIPAAQALPAPPTTVPDPDERDDEEDDEETPSTVTTSTSATTSTTNQQAATNGAAADAIAARELAVAAINAAIDDEGKPEKINEAIIHAEKGDAALEAGDYSKAKSEYREALKKAEEARREHEDGEDDD